MVYIGANRFGIGLLIRSYFNRSALLTPAGPDFRALMIGLGVLLGVLVTVAKREAWLLGFGGDFIARKIVGMAGLSRAIVVLEARLAWPEAYFPRRRGFPMKQLMIAGALALGLALPVAAQMPTGPVSKADFMASGKAKFDAADANHDGVLTREELVAVITQQMGSAPPQPMVDAILGAMDTDHDGKVTAAEAEKLRASMFDRIDANHDGTLSLDEMGAARAASMAAQQPK